MRRFIVTIGMVLGAVFGMVTPASADIAWCKADPVVMLNSTVADVTVSIPWKYVPLVNGPVRYEIATPVGTHRQLILNDLGYNGHGSQVVFVNNTEAVENGVLPTDIRVHVPIDTTRLAPGEVVPTELSIIIDDLTLMSVEGTHAATVADVNVSGLLTDLQND